MRKRKSLWRKALSPSVCEELELWTYVLLVLVAGLLLYATVRAQAARAAEFPTDVGAPTLLFQDASGSFSAAAPLETDLRLSVAGVVARVRVAQRFRNTGTTYVEALRGREYAVRLANRTGERVAVALAVDGLSSIDARRTTARAARKWILGPWETITIEGWQTGADTARKFYFTTEDDSYGAWLGKTDDLGVVRIRLLRLADGQG